MFERFTPEAREAITRAHTICREMEGPVIEPGHLLLGLLEGDDARAELTNIDVDVEALAGQVRLQLATGQPPQGNPSFSLAAKKALELSLREALTVGSNMITPLHLLRGLLRGGDPVVTTTLADRGVSLDRLVAYVVEPGPRRVRRGRRASQRFGGMGPVFGPGINHLLSGMSPRVGGRQRQGSHDLLMTMADDQSTMAGRLLKDLGITREMLEERAKALGFAGTLDDDHELREVVSDARRLAARAKHLSGDARNSAADILRAALQELEGDEGPAATA